jgi:asparagine synthase (glutamine-hydrolysing)
MRGILASPLAPPHDLSPEAIVDVVGSSVIPTPRTIYREIRKLPPGTCLQLRHGTATMETYWDVDFLNPSTQAEETLAAQTRRSLWESVRVRLPERRSWGRIGCFLSGGLDSTAVTAILTDLTQGPVKAFSIGFDQPGFNEINYARIAAAALRAEHHEHIVSPEDVREAIPLILAHFDEPYANASAVPTFICARMARDHGVDILFAGDGGDELFAGNERYATQRIFDYYTQIPAPLRRYLVRPFAGAVARLVPFGPFLRGEKYIRRARIPYSERLTSYDFFNTIPPSEIFNPDFLATLPADYSPVAHVHAIFRDAPARSNLARHLYLDLKSAISDNDVFKVTRMCGAADTAVRFPFLDPLLASFAGTIPAGRLMRGAQLRTFFKKAFADVLPVAVRRKRKHGFGLPISVWLRTDPPLLELMRELLLTPTSLQRGIFHRRAVENLIHRHETDETSFYGTAIWNLMMLELWLRGAGDQQTLER